MPAYYNEIDSYAAQWLRNLIAAGHIAPGDVDERSIEDVRPDDLRAYTQCHFFAGIGVWSHALRQAGWSDDRPVWTGSCPCQPFSAAGKGAGFADERHLWPAWQHLINQCRPAVVFGEQVASKAVDPWIDLVHADLEGMGYAFGCVPFPSAGVGAPHIRDRTYWLANSEQHGSGRQATSADHQWTQADRPADQCGGHSSSPLRLADADVLTGGQRCSIYAGRDHRSDAESRPRLGGRVVPDSERACPTNGFWRAADWLACTDGKWRPVEPGTFPLAHGATSRVGRLRAYGNAINAQAARNFVMAYRESEMFL